MSDQEGEIGELMPKEAVLSDERKKILALTRGWVTDAKLEFLRSAYKEMTISNAKEYKACVKAIGVVRGYRTKLEKSRLDKNRKDQEDISRRNNEAKRILAALVEIETPLKEMRRVEDERIAKEKAEKERVEKDRIDAIKLRMEDNFGPHCIDDLAGKPSAYVQARILKIEAYEIDSEYLEFKHEAREKKRTIIADVWRIFAARREQELADEQHQAEKAKLDAQLQAEREKLDAEKQEMAAQTKLFEEQQEEFEKEMAAWHAKRAAQEKGAEEAEAETGQAVEEDPAKEPAHEADQAGTGGDEAAEEAQGSQVTEPWPESGAEIAEFPRIDFSKEEEEDILSDEPEDEEEIVPVMLEFYLDVSDSQANRIKIVELIRTETGIKKFNDDDLADLMALARGMYLSARYNAPIRHLAGLVRKELDTASEPMELQDPEAIDGIQDF